MKKGFSIFIIVIILILILPGMLFAGGKSEMKESNEPVSLRFSWWGSDVRHQKTLAALEAYKKLTGVTIEGEYSGIQTYYEKLVTQLAGGTAPDLIQLDYPWLTELNSQGDFFVALENYDIIDFSRFDMAYVKGWCSVENVVEAVPMAQNGFTLFYNKRLVAETGVNINPSIQWTWEDLVQEGEKFVKSYPDKVFFHTDLHTIEKNIFKPYVLQQCGGQWINNNFTINFNEKQLTAAYRFILSLLEKGLIQPLDETMAYNGNIDQNPVWANGEAAVLVRWASDLYSLINDNVPEVGVSRYPVLKGAVDTGINGKPSMVLAINKNSNYVEEALKYANWMLTDDQAIEILGDVRGVPATAYARTLLEGKKLLNPDLKQAIEISSANGGTPQNGYNDNSEVTAISAEVLARVLYKQLTPEEGAKEFLRSLGDPLKAMAGK